MARTKSSDRQQNCMREIRERLSLDLPTMASMLGLPYNTYRSYEYGHRPVPTDVITKAQQIERQQRDWFVGWKRRMEAAIARQYPNGIVSEIDPDFVD